MNSQDWKRVLEKRHEDTSDYLRRQEESLRSCVRDLWFVRESQKDAERDGHLNTLASTNTRIVVLKERSWRLKQEIHWLRSELEWLEKYAGIEGAGSG